jgi:predicted anti-sigma-YlaC factor YlaD
MPVFDMSWFANLSPTCKQAARLQSDALDRRLSLSQRVGLRIHLFLCRWCRRYGQQIAILRVIGKRCAEDQDHLPADTLSAEAKERIRRRIEAEGK